MNDTRRSYRTRSIDDELDCKVVAVRRPGPGLVDVSLWRGRRGLVLGRDRESRSRVDVYEPGDERPLGDPIARFESPPFSRDPGGPGPVVRRFAIGVGGLAARGESYPGRLDWLSRPRGGSHGESGSERFTLKVR